MTRADFLVWTQDGFASPADPVFAADDRGAILGDGLFETIATRDRRAVFLAPHLCRLRAAADALDLALDIGVVREGVAAILARAAGQGALRVTVTRGGGGRGLAPIPRADQRPRHVVSWSPVGPRTDAPVKLALSRVRRDPYAPSCRHKTLSYADAAFARAEAAREGADDAVMMSTTGRAASTTIGNLWALTPGGFVTPPLSEGVLAGIVRGRLLDAGTAGGVPVRVGRIARPDLERHPLYRSNSLTGVQRAVLPGGAAPAPDNPLGRLYERLEDGRT